MAIIVHGWHVSYLKLPRHVPPTSIYILNEHYHFKRASETPTHETRKRQTIIQFKSIQSTIKGSWRRLYLRDWKRECFSLLATNVRQEEVQADVKCRLKIFVLDRQRLITQSVEWKTYENPIFWQTQSSVSSRERFAENSKNRKQVERKSQFMRSGGLRV